MLDELDAMPHPITGEYSPLRGRRVDKTSPAGKAVRVRPATLGKSRIVDWNTALLKAQADGSLKTVAVKLGKKKVVKPAKTAPVDRPEPREHTALRVARLIGEMKQHAQGRDLNGPVTPDQLAACQALARAGEMTPDEVADVEKALSDQRALPLYLIKKLGSGNT
ncbi:hypothetical protein [Paraburkholderia rhynchosiae]|uniref:hypothetical protein n=1 Tax=Paraburkholderia rhynchosiae TaxID=487049 RepID=UPI0011AF0B61|nr:hypothetical protein [Paraburkholderia rhynchosiae]